MTNWTKFICKKCSRCVDIRDGSPYIPVCRDHGYMVAEGQQVGDKGLQNTTGSDKLARKGGKSKRSIT